METCRIKEFLDRKIGASHNHRTWLGKLTPSESQEFFGVDFGSSLIRISEKEGLIQILRKSNHGNIKSRECSYKSVAYFNALSPLDSRYETTGKPRKAILQLMAS